MKVFFTLCFLLLLLSAFSKTPGNGNCCVLIDLGCIPLGSATANSGKLCVEKYVPQNNVVNREEAFDVLTVNLGPDVTVCTGATFQLNPHPDQIGQYIWSGSAGLSCMNCPSPQVSLATPGIYTYIATLITPESITDDTLVVTVLSGEQPQYDLAADQAICLGETAQVGGAAITGTTYNWSASPPGFVSIQANPSVAPLVSTTYYLNAGNGSCPVTVLDSVRVEIYTPPVLAVQADTAVCDGAQVRLGRTIPQAGVAYTWLPDDGSLDNAGSTNPLAAPLLTTWYTLTATNAGCTETRQVQVVIVPLSLQLNVPDTSLLCLGSSLSIQASVLPAGTPVSWSPLTSLQITPNGLSAVASPVESIRYTVQAVVPGCVRTGQVYVQVDSLPQNLTISPLDTTVCQGGQVVLRSPVYEPAQYKKIDFQWLPPIGQLTDDSLYNLVVQPTETTVYQRVSRHGGCLRTDSATVKVIPPAEMDIVPADTTICAGQSVQLQLTYTPGVTEIMWMPATSLTCSTCDNPTATPATTTTYEVSGKFEGCVTGTSATVTVRDLPAYRFPADRMLCGGQSVLLNEIFDPAGTYTWTSTDPAFGTFTGSQPIITPTQTATYFLKADNGCLVEDQVTITVTSGSIEAFGDTTICKGVSTQLTATSSVPGTFQWDQGAGSGSVVSVMPAATTNYTVTFYFGTDCVLTDSVLVQVVGEIALVDFPADVELCPGEGITLNSMATPGATYAWSSVPGTFTTASATPVVTPDQTTRYTVVTTLGTCVSTQTVNVVVFSGVTLTVSNDTTVCADEPLELMANGSASGFYVWSPDGGSGSPLPVQTDSTTTHRVLYTYGDGCTLTDSVKVTVIANFALEIIATPDTNSINLGESIELFAKISPSQNLNGFQYIWLENNQRLDFTTEIITARPGTTDSTVTYIVEVLSPAGCRQTAAITFNLIQPKVVFPNAFTPNGDQVNGTFKMLVQEGFATVDRMEIYNRWGQKVFDSTEPAAEWDGRVDGREAPSDVYACKIRWRRGDGALKIYVGEIMLLR